VTSAEKYAKQPMTTAREETSQPRTRHGRSTEGEQTKAVSARTVAKKEMEAETRTIMWCSRTLGNSRRNMVQSWK